MKILLTLLTLLISANHLLAQEEINKLTLERETLYRKYKESESLSTGLFGNRSKDDLQATIDALNEIIKKDNEILNELKHIQEDSKLEFTNKYNDLIRQNNELSDKNRALLELSERHKGYSKENHQMLEETEQKQILHISLLAIFAILSLIYIVKYFSLKSDYKQLKSNNVKD